MSNASADDTRALVRDHYAKVSKGETGCAPGCCATQPPDQSRMLGYSADDLTSVPAGADMGLGLMGHACLPRGTKPALRHISNRGWTCHPRSGCGQALAGAQ